MEAQNNNTGRKTGHVKFFDCQKGFGFIVPDEPIEGTSGEIFVHHTSIVNSGGFRSLAEGEEVEFDLIQGEKGLQASNVSGPNGAPVKGDPRGGRNNNGNYMQNNSFNNRRYQNQQNGYQQQGQWGYGYQNQYQRPSNQMPGFNQNNGYNLQQNYPVPQYTMQNVEQ